LQICADACPRNNGQIRGKLVNKIRFSAFNLQNITMGTKKKSREEKSCFKRIRRGDPHPSKGDMKRTFFSKKRNLNHSKKRRYSEKLSLSCDGRRVVEDEEGEKKELGGRLPP